MDGQLGDEVAFPELIYSLLNGDHLKGTQRLSSFKFLHIKGTQTCVGKVFRHDPKVFTHKYLVYPVAGQQISGGQLRVVPGVSGQDGKNIVFDIGQQMVGLEHREREWVQPEEP